MSSRILSISTPTSLSATSRHCLGYLDTVIVNDHNHIALWDESGQFNRYVTSSAQWGVESLHCYDPTLAVLYVTASYPSSIERTVLAVDVDTGNWSVLVPTPSPTWQQASFSGNCSYFTLSEQANLPTSTLASIARRPLCSTSPPSPTTKPSWTPSTATLCPPSTTSPSPPPPLRSISSTPSSSFLPPSRAPSPLPTARIAIQC